MSVLGSPVDILCEIEEVGNTIKIEVITETSYNKYGDATDTTGEFVNVKAAIQSLSFNDEMNVEGLHHSGDIICFIPSNEETDCALFKDQERQYRNKIIWRYDYYEIMEIILHEHDDEIFVYEVRAKKV